MNSKKQNFRSGWDDLNEIWVRLGKDFDIFEKAFENQLNIHGKSLIPSVSYKYDTRYPLDFYTVEKTKAQNPNKNDLLSMAVDVTTKDDSVKVVVEIPGVEKDDINVTLCENVLEISCDKKVEEESKYDSGDYSREISYGSLYRKVILPYLNYSDDIEHNYKNGVLTLKFKVEEQKKISKKII